MMKSPVFLAIALLLVTLVAVGYQAHGLNKVRLGKTVILSEPAKPAKKNDDASKLSSLAQLAKQHLMGDPNKAPKKTTTEVVPIATLRLVLMGTIIKTEGGVSSAFIQAGNKETKRYNVGEPIEGGFVLNAVAADSVVLKRDDHLEVLKYPVNVAPAAPAQPVPVSATNPATRPPQPNMPATATQPNDANRAKSLRERMRAQANKNGQQNPPSK